MRPKGLSVNVENVCQGRGQVQGGGETHGDWLGGLSNPRKVSQEMQLMRSGAKNGWGTNKLKVTAALSTQT